MWRWCHQMLCSLWLNFWCHNYGHCNTFQQQWQMLLFGKICPSYNVSVSSSGMLQLPWAAVVVVALSEVPTLPFFSFRSSMVVVSKSLQLWLLSFLPYPCALLPRENGTCVDCTCVISGWHCCNNDMPGARDCACTIRGQQYERGCCRNRGLPAAPAVGG